VLEAYNANYVGGDIAAGAADGLQVVLRPIIAIDPYRAGTKSLYLCSASTPPGAGVHGMCGYWAARSALRNM
jgi:phytoene dehydrogenase-like protein